VGLFHDLLGLDAIERYFELHYWKSEHSWDRHAILGCFALSPIGEPLCDFRRASEHFRLITEETRPIVIPWRRQGRALVQRLRADPLPDRVTRRALQRYMVSAYPEQWDRLYATGCLDTVSELYAVLENPDTYDRDTGLSLEGAPMIT